MYAMGVGGLWVRGVCYRLRRAVPERDLCCGLRRAVGQRWAHAVGLGGLWARAGRGVADLCRNQRP